MRVRVKFDTETRRAAGAATGRFGIAGRLQVDVVDADNKVHIQPVTVGERSGSLWIIEDGLQPAQRVVVEGLQKIREGMAVSHDQFCRGADSHSPSGRPTK